MRVALNRMAERGYVVQAGGRAAAKKDTIHVRILVIRFRPLVRGATSASGMLRRSASTAGCAGHRWEHWKAPFCQQCAMCQPRLLVSALKEQTSDGCCSLY